jgi:hypothetical protein
LLRRFIAGSIAARSRAVRRGERVLTRIRNHLRGNVVGYVALLMALSGTAYAVDGPLAGQNTVGSADIIDQEVKTADIGNGEVRHEDIATDAVKTEEIGNGEVTSADVLDNSLTSADVNFDSLTGADVAFDSIKGGDIDESSLALGCNEGTILGFALVPGRGSFNSDFQPVGGYNCAAQGVFARRASEGVYWVDFPGNPARLGVGSVDYSSRSGAEDDFLTVHSETIEGDTFFIVQVHDADDGDTDDDRFTLMVF